MQSSLQGNEGAYQAQARGGINQGVISLGLTPTDSSLNGWLDPGTAAAAQANPLSTGAQEATAHTNNLRDIQNQLAARGAYDSGELTYGLGNENQRDTKANADSMASFLQYAQGLFGNLASMKAGDATQLGSELGNAAMRQLALHPGSTTSATWDDATGTYVDSNGNHYDQWGNHIGTVGDGSTPTSFGTPPPTTDSASISGGSENPPSSTLHYPAPVFNAPGVEAPTQSPARQPYTPPDQPILTRGGGSLTSRTY